MKIQLDHIDPNPAQPRRRFEDLEQLAGSIKADGLLEPIMVRPMGERFQIVHGERRWRACKIAGLAEIDATVREMDDTMAFKLALVENIQRQDLDPMEEADAFTFLQDKGMTQAAIGGLIHKSQQYVADRLALLRLPDQVQNMITARAVSPSLARRLVSIGNKRKQIKLAESAALGYLTVRNLEREIESAEIGADRARLVARATAHEPERRKAYFNVLIQHSGKARDKAVFKEMVKDAPQLESLAGAVEDRELLIDDTYGPNGSAGLKLKFPQLSHISGQTWRWPEYSGAVKLTGPNSFNHDAGLQADKWWEDLTVPVFSEQEWEEFKAFDEKAAVGQLDFPNKEQFLLPKLRTPEDYECPINRRLYDPAHGRMMVEQHRCGHGCHEGGPVFVKQGWGTWIIVEFNDGQGNRMRRRFFQHDHVDSTFIEQAMDTIDPFLFSNENFKKLRLWQAQPVQMSWAYIRRATLPKEEMIAALKADLEDLESAEEISVDERDEHLLNYLQSYVRLEEDRETWREGTCTYPRLPDGTVDAEECQKYFPQQEVQSAA